MHPFQPAQGLDFANLETADPGRFLEDHTAVLGRRLQQNVNLTLLDDAVGLGAHARAGKQIANIAQAGRIAVDQILALAATINAARDLDLGGIDGQQMFRVVEGQRDFGRVHGSATARAVENHVGHLAATQTFDALLAERPFDGINHVRLARSVGADDDGNTLGKLEPRSVGKTLKTDEFECLEHGKIVLICQK